MKKLFLFLFLISCQQEKLIYYNYNDVTVTRRDEGNQIFFYYGKFTSENLPQSYIGAEYKGFDGAVQAYLTFLPSRQVELRRIMGVFTIFGNEKKITIVQEENVTLNPFLETLNGNFKNTIQVSNSLKLEQKINLKNKSQVTTNY